MITIIPNFLLVPSRSALSDQQLLLFLTKSVKVQRKTVSKHRGKFHQHHLNHNSVLFGRIFVLSLWNRTGKAIAGSSLTQWCQIQTKFDGHTTVVGAITETFPILNCCAAKQIAASSECDLVTITYFYFTTLSSPLRCTFCCFKCK